MPKPKRINHAVHQETLTPPAQLDPSHAIARLKQAAGKNLYHLELPPVRDTQDPRGGSTDLAESETILAELPAKFRSTIWLKRGSYVLVDTAALADRDNKLSGQIINIVGDEKAWRKMPYWPIAFPPKTTAYADDSDDDAGPMMPPSDSGSE